MAARCQARKNRDVKQMKSLDLFSKVQFQLGSDEICEYYVYPKNQKRFDRVLIYIHGLISDIYWFEIPPHLPKGTGILFLSRHPRTHVDSFVTWTRHYEACFLDFKKSHASDFYHLIGHCFGALPALHWASTKPENFTTLTLVSPPFHVKDNFGILSKLGIVFGPREKPRKCLLTPRSFSRLPSIRRFIENNPTTTFEFSNALFLETARLASWLRKNVIAYPIPTHYVFSSEDDVIGRNRALLNGDIQDIPDETTFLYSDHYAELLPNKQGFWESVFHFQTSHEAKYESKGKIKKVLVTGATGFLGSHIVRQLHSGGKEVVAFVRNPQKAAQKFPGIQGKIEFRTGNLDDLSSIENALEGIDAVVHTAAHVSDWDRSEKFENANVEGTKNLLMIAHSKDIKQFIHISSLGIFGDTDQKNIDENNAYVLSSDYYSNSKIRAEIFVKKYCRANNIPFTIIRPGFIYGEEDNNFFPKLIKALELKQFKFIGSKENILNVTYVGNVAALVHEVIGNPACFGQTYNISDHEHVKIGDFISKIVAELHLPEPEKVVPKNVAFAAAALVESIYRALNLNQPPPITGKKVTFSGRSRSVNCEKAYQLMGRTPFSFDEGIKRTLEYLKQ